MGMKSLRSLSQNTICRNNMTQIPTRPFAKIDVITCICCLVLPYLLFVVTPGGMGPFFHSYLFWIITVSCTIWNLLGIGCLLIFNIPDILRTLCVIVFATPSLLSILLGPSLSALLSALLRLRSNYM